MGRTHLRKPQASAIFGTLSVGQVSKPARASPRCFHASQVPTSLGLIGRPHACGDCYHELSEETLRRRPSCRARNELGRPRVGVSRSRRDRSPTRIAQVSLTALHGRRGVRKSFWDATRRSQLPHRKARRSIPRMCLVPSVADGNRNNRSSRCRTE